MARPTKIVDIYNNYGEIIETTVPEFLENHPEITRSGLYKESGSVDSNGTTWRIGELPRAKKEPMNEEAQRIYNFLEADYLFWVFTGVNRAGVSVEELKSAILSYNHNFFILDTQYLTNLHKVFAEDVTPTINLDTYRHWTITYGRKSNLKEWTSNDTIDKLLLDIEEEVAKKAG